jgi:hypothetical protein
MKKLLTPICWIIGHNYKETFNDGKTQILTCEFCGYESEGWF